MASTANHSWYAYQKIRSLTPIHGVVKPASIRGASIPLHAPNAGTKAIVTMV